MTDLRLCFPGNRAHPADGKSLFLHDDPRMALTIKDFDPRIHFALVCGAKVSLDCSALPSYASLINCLQTSHK